MENKKPPQEKELTVLNNSLEKEITILREFSDRLYEAINRLKPEEPKEASAEGALENSDHHLSILENNIWILSNINIGFSRMLNRLEKII